MPEFRTHSLVCLRYNDEKRLPQAPLIARVISQMTAEPPVWLDAEVLGYGRFSIRGNDCDKLVPPKNCAKPEICVRFPSKSQFDAAVHSMTPEQLAKVKVGANEIRLPFGLQPAQIIPGLSGGASFSLAPTLADGPAL